jgi:formylglycine-generating enzyme required for sulfatase activity
MSTTKTYLLVLAISVSFFASAESHAAAANGQDVLNALQALSAELKRHAETEDWPDGYCGGAYRSVNDLTARSQALLEGSRGGAPDRHPRADEFKKKLADLERESASLRDWCQAPGFRHTGIDRPFFLRAAMAEWNVAIEWIIARLHAPQAQQPTIAPAARSGVNVTPATPPGTTFKDCEDACPILAVVPPGQYRMGGTPEEQQKFHVPSYSKSYESPAHDVTIRKAIAVAIHETTVGQYKRFVAETGWETPRGCRDWVSNASANAGNPSYRADFLIGAYFVRDYSYDNPGFAQKEDEPVVCVRREDARAFADWLSKKTGQRYRLPSEAEWEYFARAGTVTTFFWGDDDVRGACDFANVYDVTSRDANKLAWDSIPCNDGFARTSPVGSFKPNRWGIYDVTANAREWVDDCWNASYENGPFDERRVASGECNFPILRGGAWAYQATNIRIAYRNAYLCSEARSNMWGFRLVREL